MKEVFQLVLTALLLVYVTFGSFSAKISIKEPAKPVQVKNQPDYSNYFAITGKIDLDNSCIIQFTPNRLDTLQVIEEVRSFLDAIEEQYNEDILDKLTPHTPINKKPLKRI